MYPIYTYLEKWKDGKFVKFGVDECCIKILALQLFAWVQPKDWMLVKFSQEKGSNSPYWNWSVILHYFCGVNETISCSWILFHVMRCLVLQLTWQPKRFLLLSPNCNINLEWSTAPLPSSRWKHHHSTHCINLCRHAQSSMTVDCLLADTPTFADPFFSQAPHMDLQEIQKLHPLLWCLSRFPTLWQVRNISLISITYINQFKT